MGKENKSGFRLVAFIVVVCWLTACTQGGVKSGVAQSEPQASNTKSEEKEKVDQTYPKAPLPLRVLVSPEDCPNRANMGEYPLVVAILVPLLAKLAEKLIPTVVEFGYDRTVKYLNESQMRLNSSSTAMTSTSFYETSFGGDGKKPSFKCLILIRGEMTADKFTDSVYNKYANRVSNYPELSKAVLEKNWSKWRLTAPPELYMELQVVAIQTPIVSAKGQKTGDATTYFKLKPLVVYYLGTGAQDSGKNKKHVAVELSISRPLVQDRSLIVKEAWDLGQMNIGDKQFLPHLDGNFAPLPARVDIGAGLTDAVPVSITAIVTETGEGGDFARVVARKLEDAETKKALVDTVSGPLVDEAKKQIGKIGAGKEKQ